MKNILYMTAILALTAACGGSGGGSDTQIDTNPPTGPVTPVDPVDPGTPGVDPVDPNNPTQPDIRDVLSVNTSGGRYDLSDAVAGFIAGEQRYKINVAAAPKKGGFGDALVYVGTNLIAAGGTDTGNQPNFSVVTGTTSAPPAGTAQFVGHYSIADALEVLEPAQEHGALTLNYSLAQNTVTGTSANSVLIVNGTADAAGAITGSVTVAGSPADLTGAFYGADAAEVAAGFTNDDFGGYIYGAKAP